MASIKSAVFLIWAENLDKCKESVKAFILKNKGYQRLDDDGKIIFPDEFYEWKLISNQERRVILAAFRSVGYKGQLPTANQRIIALRWS